MQRSKRVENMMNIFEDKEALQKIKKAGEIATRARDYGVKLVKEGILAVELADNIEKKIFDLGAKPAF